MLFGGDEEISWRPLAWNSILHEMSLSLGFTVFRVKHEKVGFTKDLSMMLASRVLQERGLSAESFPMPIPEYNWILQGFNFFTQSPCFSMSDFVHLVTKYLYPIVL